MVLVLVEETSAKLLGLVQFVLVQQVDHTPQLGRQALEMFELRLREGGLVILCMAGVEVRQCLPACDEAGVQLHCSCERVACLLGPVERQQGVAALLVAATVFRLPCKKFVECPECGIEILAITVGDRLHVTCLGLEERAGLPCDEFAQQCLGVRESGRLDQALRLLQPVRVTVFCRARQKS